MSELNIYQRLLKITEELEPVEKNMTVGLGNSQYKGVGEADVLNAVKPLEAKYGVYSYPMNREIVYAETFVGEKAGYKPTDPPKTTYKFVIRLKTTYRFVNVDTPTEFIDQVSISDGEDPMDKAPGKAETYGDKFALLKAYKIVTGVDTDNEHSEDTTPTNMKPYKKKAPQKQYSTLGNKNEADATQDANQIGLDKVMSALDKPENANYKRTVISTVCKEQNVDSWNMLKLGGKFTYKDLIERVASIIDELKKIEKAGI